ncbi:BLUF domain-containing protein [Caulobacter sp. RL271]|jgi:hypothetical protein|uniref:BLUF domain-containing protein n=1 Tax=Caulobacter segnis TaxID=88688 RepID=A0ABY4ZNZ5_9CAUL|nr:BLUF domain-containing protein [Caulobacter segnis]USQ94270.1 BLUF domain-containing protein [Caulobacter segnis]
MSQDDKGRGRLRRLIYASRFTGAERAFDEVLRAIIAKSIQNNRLDDITGFLVVAEGRFLQWLEGPETALEETFARIARDQRHADLRTLADGPADHRRFRDWNMGQHRLGRIDQPLLSEVGLDVFNPAGLDAERAECLLVRVGGRYLRG